MSFSSIKDWIASVDLSHTDWRLRWPVILLPFLLIALVYLLLRANQLSGVHAQSMLQLQKLFQSNAAVPSAAIDTANTGAKALALFDSGVAKLESDSQLLQKWLLQGRNLQSSAEYAAALVDIVTTERSNNAGLPEVDFWNGFSDVLSILENAVIEGDIKTPEARGLISDLRTQYAQLRTIESVPTQNTVDVVHVDVVQAQADRTQQIRGVLARSGEQRASITKLHNGALVLAALSTALFGLLLWGLWRSAQRRQNAVLGRHRNEQGAILRLLDEITPLAQGDLRVKATVSEASTGAVADAFNFAVDELRRLVRAVTESADMVKTSVHETRESAHLLAKASSVQAREIHRSSNYLSVMSDTMAQLSAHAVESSRIADLSVQQARAGNQSVQANVDSLLRIKEQAQMTSRLMQRLVETSTTINERVSDIQAVAKRTDLLALNATIKSSAQISNGGSENVSMLSDEIAHLADTLGRASRDITNLSDLIQQDATITLKSMAKTVEELDEGQHTANLAKLSLDEIERVSNELNGLISDIASKSLRQAGVVKQLSGNMGVINNITRDSTLQLQDSAKALETLELITAELRDSVSDFKLPRNSINRDSTQRLSLDSTGTNQSRVNSKVARSTVKHA